MKPQLVLSLAGLLMTFAPGCCVVEKLFGCHYWHGGSCGQDLCDNGCGHSKKCAKKCRKCRECLEEHGGYAGGGMYPDMAMSGDCGCGCGGDAMMMGGMMGGEIYGGDMGFGGGGGCGCSQGGGMAPMMNATPYMTTPPMTVPTPGPGPGPTPQSGTMLPPPIPPMETGRTSPAPSGTQQVSVEEFQRLPGVIVSGPGAQTAGVTGSAAASPSFQVSTSTGANPAQSVALPTAVPTNARQIQQTGWAPVRK